jgi:hypothetical protein
MSCPSYVRRFVSTLSEGQVFTTRDCLILGKRANVDKALQKLVKTKAIVRLARGVFIRCIGTIKLPSMHEMAKIKAKAFGKNLRIHGKDTAAMQGLMPDENEEHTFYVDGSTSSFQYRGCKINLKRCSRKRMTIEDTRAGLAIRALWAVGRRNVNYSLVEKISHFWHSNNIEKQAIYHSKAWMPSWLGDFFPPTTYLGPQPRWTTDIPPALQVKSDTAQLYQPFSDSGPFDYPLGA